MSEIKNDIKNKGNIFFIKPFEIVSSYYSFMETWAIANRVYKENKDVADARLMQSYSDDAKFGYISYSNWKTKEAFLKSNLSNTVLKYHNALNGESSNTAKHNLYNLLSEEIYNQKSKSKKTLEILVIETDLPKDERVIEYWESVCAKITKRETINSISLYKSIYRKSKYRYIGIINMMEKDNKGDYSTNSHINNRKDRNNEIKIYSSVYKTVKKYS